MTARCEICNRGVNPRDMVYCRYCKTPFHLDCIKSHQYSHGDCPHCGRTTNLAHYRRGVPSSLVAEQPQYESQTVAPAQRSAPSGKAPPKAQTEPQRKRGAPKRAGGGKAIFLINLIIISLLVASTHYAHTTYVEYAPGLYADENTKVVIPGQEAEFLVTLQNTGNIVSRYQIYLDEDSVAFPSGWEILFHDDTVTYEELKIERSLEPAEEFQFKVRISTTGSSEANAVGAFKIIASSKDGKYASSEIFSVTAEAIYTYTLQQNDSKKYVSAGDTAQFSAEIENLGNNTDTYYLRLEGLTQGWVANLLSQQAEIEAKRSGEVILTMTAPANAQGNQEGEVVLRVSSQYDPEDVKTVKFTLVVNPSYAFDITSSELSKEVLPGTTASFTFKLRNLGNLTDTFKFTATASLPYGWDYELSKGSATLSADEQITLGLSIIVPDDASGETEGKVNLIIESEGNSDYEMINFSVTTVEEQGKYILVELITSFNCTFCPYAESALNNLMATYPGKIIVLEHHINDTLSTPFALERNLKYGLAGYPHAIFDGNKKESGGSTSSYNEYVSIVEQLINEEPKVRIYLAVSDSITNPGKSTVNALIMTDGLDSDTQIDVVFVTYRNGMTTTGYSSKIYNYVTIDGFKSTLSNLDSIENITTTIEIPDDGGLVVFVQDTSTKKVYQTVVI